MENKLQTFTHQAFGSVRTIIIEEEPWFVGKDVTDILGYQNGSRDINRHVEEEDRHKDMLFDGNQDKETIIINESGLYSLILSSKMPNAKKFKHWVTSEVLPSIRKHGGYFAGQEDMSEVELLSRAVLVANNMIEEKQKTIDTQKQQISELEPSAAYCDKILKTKNAVPTSVIAKDFGWSPQRLNNYLQEKHVQYKVGETWVLYQEHCDKGYTKSFTFTYRTWAGDEESVVQTKWTQAGRKFIYELLKADGILPVIEAVV